jgi:tRNA modification GTPase
LAIGQDLKIDCRVYVFPEGQSYTGQAQVELHLEVGPFAIEQVSGLLAKAGARPAQPGEFTARAFLLGRMNLAEAEAVNQLISASNSIQQRTALDLIRYAGGVRPDGELLEILSILEAGMDFAEEDIGPLPRAQLIHRLQDLINLLSEILRSSTQQEGLGRLASVGLAGLPNAGKSTLFNTLCHANSMVSPIPGTTTDILEAILDLEGQRCILFDSPGLDSSNSLIDWLAYQAAIETLHRADAIIFCVDVSRPDYQQDLQIHSQIGPGQVIYVATKADLLDDAALQEGVLVLNRLFDATFIPVSALTDRNIQILRRAIQQVIAPIGSSIDPSAHRIAISERMRHALGSAIDSLTDAQRMLQDGSDELAAMCIRSAYCALTASQTQIDEKVLQTIFSRFCIGK